MSKPRATPAGPEAELAVLVVSLDRGVKEVGNVAFQRAGQYIAALAERGVNLRSSGTFPPWIWPWGWTDDPLGILRQLWGLAAGAVKRVLQAFTLPRYDTVVILRDVWFYTGPPFFERLFAERSHFLVFELDDAIFLEPEGKSMPPLWTPTKVETAAALADRVIAGNEYLADWARQFCDDVVVIPTAGGDWLQPREGSRRPGPVRVCWSGHIEGAPFLDGLMDPLVAARRRCEFDLELVSAPAILEMVREAPELQRHLTVWENPETESCLSDFDIGIMPLDDSEFAKGKCAFKLIRYMAAGLPVVASAVAMNCEVVVDGETGFLVSTPQEWTDAVVRLVTDPDLRERMGKAGRRRYEQLYSPAAVLPRYLEAITPPPDKRVVRRRGMKGMGRQRGRQPR